MFNARFATVFVLPFVGSVLFGSERPFTFERDIQPLLTRAGCNAGSCHGKARGQNGFALSLLGFDPDFDHDAIVKEARGRRVFAANPEHSLLLLKASGEVSHGGGKKLPKGSASYQKVLTWIAAGAQRTKHDSPRLKAISIEPTQLIARFGQQHPLRVIAHYSDNTKEDVTDLASYQSNESGYVAVHPSGEIKAGTVPGEAAITARYVDRFAVCRVLIPLPATGKSVDYRSLPKKNFIDEHVWEKCQQLGLVPSSVASETTLHRRAFLDIIGRFPTPVEMREFERDRRSNKYELLIDRLLDRPEYADFWANKWADLLRPNPYHVGIKATYNFDSWIREQFRANKPYDQFVRELLTAQGSTFQNGATVFYRNRREPAELATMVSQLFLGVRLECAKCHQHPSENWGQRDFYSFAAFFSRIGHKGTGISAPISGSEEVMFVAESGEVRHPLSGEVLKPIPLAGRPIDSASESDPRAVLVDWMTNEKNPYFAKAIVNRVWADLMGRGLVDPVDDLRETNPPTNPVLLDAMAEDFRKSRHNLKSLIRRIATSQAYSLSSIPNDRNVGDVRNYSRHYRQRLRAEVLIDAVSDVTGVPEKFDAMPPGARAMQAWTVRFDSKFLDSFGRPDPNQDPPCERTGETTVVQALHLMNSPTLSAKITSDTGRAATLAASKKSNAEIVDELYLLAYGRPPKADELTACLARFDKKDAKRRTATEDLMWALINTPEFVFKD